MRESTAARALRMIAERRVDLRWCNHAAERGPVAIAAKVRGEHGVYRTALRQRTNGLVPECSCDANPGKCWHVAALEYLFALDVEVTSVKPIPVSVPAKPVPVYSVKRCVHIGRHNDARYRCYECKFSGRCVEEQEES